LGAAGLGLGAKLFGQFGGGGGVPTGAG
jgi:hypothetical protein